MYTVVHTADDEALTPLVFPPMPQNTVLLMIGAEKETRDSSGSVGP